MSARTIPPSAGSLSCAGEVCDIQRSGAAARRSSRSSLPIRKRSKSLSERMSTFSDGDRIIDPLRVPAIPDRPGYEDGRAYDLPAELKSGDDAFALTVPSRRPGI